MFAFSHDYRIMRKDRGFLCLNELDINMKLPAGMTSSVQNKVTPNAYREIMYAHRLTGEKAKSLDAIDFLADSEDACLAEAL